MGVRDAMKINTYRAYIYHNKCIECYKDYKIYYTLENIGDPPCIMHCKICGVLYWSNYFDRTSSLVHVGDLKCVKCQNSLANTLVPTHKYIKCVKCGDVFSLDDDFAGHYYPDDENTELVRAYEINT